MNEKQPPNVRISNIVRCRKEITDAILSLILGKAPRSDNVPPELFKASDSTTVDLLPLLRKIWNQENIPTVRKGGLTILQKERKLLVSKLLERINCVVDPLVRLGQECFRPNKSCIDQIKTLRSVVTIKRMTLSSVPSLCRLRTGIQHNCTEQNLERNSQRSIRLIQKMYKEVTYYKRDKKNEGISIRRGVQQGFPL